MEEIKIKKLLTINFYQNWYSINAKAMRSYPNGPICKLHNLNIFEFKCKKVKWEKLQNNKGVYLQNYSYLIFLLI